MPDARDERLRRLLSSLPRMQAPPGFEERLLRRINAAGPKGRSIPPWLRAYTAPALALLLVGALSYLVYMTQMRTAGEPPRPETDTVPAGATRSTPAPAARAPEAAPSPAAGNRSGAGETRAVPPARDAGGLRLEGGVDLASPSLESRGKMSRPGVSRRISTGALSAPKDFFGFGSPGLMNAGGAAPGRMMMEPAVPGGDSSAKADTAATDSARRRPSTQPDSAGLPDPRRAPTHTQDPGGTPEGE